MRQRLLCLVLVSGVLMREDNVDSVQHGQRVGHKNVHDPDVSKI